MKFLIAGLILNVVVSLVLFQVKVEQLDSRIFELQEQDKRLLEIDKTHGKNLDDVVGILDTITRTPEMVKMPDAPPLRYQLTDTATVALQYWTEKDGWQFIPKNFK